MGYAGGNGNGNGTGNGVVGQITEFGNDVFSLAELQARLAAVDLKESTRLAVVPVIALAGAGALGLAALMVGLFGVGELISRALTIHEGWGLLIAAAAAVAVAGLIAFVFGRQIGSSFIPLRRSREEFTRNLAWVRTVMVHSGRSVARR